MVEVLCRYSNTTEQVKRVRRIATLVQKTWADRPKSDGGNRCRVVFRLGEGEVAQLIADYESGMTGRQLAEQYGLARSTVIDLLKQHGVVVRHPRVTPDETAQMVELYRQGLRQTDIAKQMGRDKGLIWHVLKRAGLL